LAFHLRWVRTPRPRYSIAAALFAGAGLLANILSVPLAAALALNTLCLPFDRRGLRNWRAQRVYVQHLSRLFLAFAIGIIPQVFMLPHLLYGSVVYEGLSTRRWSPIAILKLIGDPLVLASSASSPIVGGLIVLAMVVAVRRTTQATGVERSG